MIADLASVAAAILRLDERGSYTEDDHHQLQELAPTLARAWLERRVEYRPGLPPAAAIEAHAARGGCWQHQREGRFPRIVRLRVKHLPFLTEGCAPEIQGLYSETAIWGLHDEATGWFRVEGTGWRTTTDPLRRAALRAQDLTEGSWRPCSFPDGDPLSWPGEAGPAPALADRAEEALRVVVRFPFRDLHQPLKQILEAHPCLGEALHAYARRDLRGCAAELRAVLQTWQPRTTAGARDREHLTVWAWILARVEGGAHEQGPGEGVAPCQNP